MDKMTIRFLAKLAGKMIASEHGLVYAPLNYKILKKKI